MYALALAELAGAVLLWIPHYQLLAIGGLLVLMVGAVLVLLRHHESAAHLRVPLVVLVLLLVLGYLQWPTAGSVFSAFSY